MSKTTADRGATGKGWIRNDVRQHEEDGPAVDVIFHGACRRALFEVGLPVDGSEGPVGWRGTVGGTVEGGGPTARRFLRVEWGEGGSDGGYEVAAAME